MTIGLVHIGWINMLSHHHELYVCTKINEETLYYMAANEKKYIVKGGLSSWCDVRIKSTH